MNPYKCQVCGETYLGADRPDRCPFCGAAGHHLVRPTEWVVYGDLDLSPKTVSRLEQALELELDNAGFYYACAEKAETRITQSIFKRLYKHEMEHAELVSDLMGGRELQMEKQGCPDSDAEKFTEAHRRELRAIKFYLEVSDTAPEPRIREVMRALAEVESEHLKVSNLYR